MRLFAVLLAICRSCQSAIARTGRSTRCAIGKREAIVAEFVSDSKADTEKHVDLIGAEQTLDECAAKKYQPRSLSA